MKSYINCFIVIFLLLPGLYQVQGQDLKSEQQEQAILLVELAQNRLDLGDLQGAKEHYAELEVLIESVKARKYSNYGHFLVSLANYHFLMEDHALALEYGTKAVQMAEEELGKEFPGYVQALSVMANANMELGNYETAEEQAEQSFTISKAIYGLGHEETRTGKSNLAKAFLANGKVSTAIRMYKEIISEQKAPVINQIVSYSNLAYAYNEINRPDSAVYYMELVKAAIEKNNASPGPSTVGVYKNLGVYYSGFNNKKAIENMYRYNEMVSEVYGANSMVYAGGLTDLAVFYHQVGRMIESYDMVKKAEVILSKNWKSNPVYSIQCLSLLADVYVLSENFDKAFQYFQTYQALVTEFYGDEGQEYAEFLNGYAKYLMGIEEYQSAARHQEAAMSFYQNAGDLNTAYFGIGVNLVQAYAMAGENAKGFELAKRLRREVKDKPHILPSLKKNTASLLMIFYQAMNDVAKMNELLQEVLELSIEEFNNTFPFSNEEQKQEFLKDRYPEILSSISPAINLEYKPENADLLRTLGEFSLFFKGLVTRSTYNNSFEKATTAESSYLRQQLAGLDKEVLKAISKGEAGKAQLADLQKRKKQLEYELYSLIDYTPFVKTDFRSLSKSLKPDEVAIEFLKWSTIGLEENLVGYSAMIIDSRHDYPMFTPFLFNEKDMERMLKGRSVNRTYNTSRTSEGASLYDLAWGYLDQLIANHKKVYFSPVGVLNKLSFAGLLDNEGNRLSDKYELVQLSDMSTLEYRPNVRFDGNDQALVYGGIDYDSKPSASGVGGTDTSDSEKLFETALRNYYGEWAYLQGTEMEAREIVSKLGKQNFNVQYINADKASEQQFRQKNGQYPALVHFATHGYFFKDRSGFFLTESQESTDALSSYMRSSNPLVRSGIIMAGANYYSKSGGAEPEENGILTGLEIQSLDMSSTKLVVLSACNTAVGDIRGSENVYGLQRAFKMAGVEHIVMSLWPVDDLATSELMISFYDHLSEGQEVELAFTKARQKLREQYDTEVDKWAGFILVR